MLCAHEDSASTLPGMYLLQDPEFPASELLYPGPDSKGWCTPRCAVGGAGGGGRGLCPSCLPRLPAAITRAAPSAPLTHTHSSAHPCRHCQYPQELTLRLEQPARLAQVQLLSHEFKIAGRLELLVAGGEQQPPQQQQQQRSGGGKDGWRRLGFLSFDSNERSGFAARELKSVALAGTPAQLLRLVLHRCHANAANAYGQVHPWEGGDRAWFITWWRPGGARGAEVCMCREHTPAPGRRAVLFACDMPLCCRWDWSPSAS